MSLLTPERVPVSVFKWDDVGAPQFDKNAGCVANILKTCLVTGYGNNSGAGWTAPFPSDPLGVTVLRPAISPHTDFFLRLSGDTGAQIAAKVYANMTDINNGDLKLECATPFNYAKTVTTDKWCLIASPRGFYFFCEQVGSGVNSNKKGSFFIVGDTKNDLVGRRHVFLQHTGGSATGGYSSLLGVSDAQGAIDKSSSYYVSGKLLIDTGEVKTIDAASFFQGTVEVTTGVSTSPLVLIANKEIVILPGIFASSNSALSNFDVTNMTNGNEVFKAINFGTSAYADSNFYVSSDHWVY